MVQNTNNQNNTDKPPAKSSTEVLDSNQVSKTQAETPLYIQEILRRKEKAENRVKEFYNARYNELHHVYSYKDKQIEGEIEQIRLELKQLAKKVKDFNQEVYKATSVPVASTKTGVYYKSFFSHLKEVIDTLKQQVDDAGSWLAMYKKRCKSKSAYAQGAQKHGAQYMFSEERALASSVG